MTRFQSGRLASFLLAAALAAPALAADPVKVGVLLSTTGPGAATGIPDRNGLLLAQKAINAAGGVQGRPLELVFEDDTSSPDVAISKVNTLIHTHKVKVVIGPNLIGNTVAAGSVTDKLGIPQLALTGINQAAEGNRKCVFHTLPAQELNARGLLAYATKGLKAKRVAILHDTGYGQVVTNALKELRAEYGVEYVGIEKFEIGATDVTTQAAKLKAVSPEAVLVISLSAVPFRAVRQVRLNVPILAANASATYETVKAMGEAADNIVFPEHVVGEDPLPHQKEFVPAFQKEYGQLPKSFETAAWDSLHIAVRALVEAGPDAPGQKVCDAMRKPHQGALARFDFTAKDLTGLRLSDTVYSKLTAGKFSRLPFKAD